MTAASARRLAYTVVEGRLPSTHHQATVEVVAVPDRDGSCRLVWTTDVLPDELAGPIGALMDAGAEAMRRGLAAS